MHIASDHRPAPPRQPDSDRVVAVPHMSPRPTSGDAMTSTHIPEKGVFLDAAVCSFYFRLGLNELNKQRLDGGRATSPLRQAQDALRAAAQEQSMSAMSANGPVSSRSADMDSESIPGGFISTEAMAERLNVTPRHALRLATQAGIDRAARDAWPTTDVERLIQTRRTA